MTITKTKSHVKIEKKDWENLKKNPVIAETIELLEDISDLKKAKRLIGKSIQLEDYLKKRGL